MISEDNVIIYLIASLTSFALDTVDRRLRLSTKEPVIIRIGGRRGTTATTLGILRGREIFGTFPASTKKY